VLTITDIITPAEQGITKPFLCRADDGYHYFVKRPGTAGRKALIAEYVAGCMADRLGLPVPPFAIAEVPRSLLALRPSEERSDWGEGPAFASRMVERTVELRITDIERVPLAVRASVLLFDAWVGNDDRQLGELGGNPNMLWSDHVGRLTIIDHNLAFETPAGVVLANHAFNAAASAWDLVFQATWIGHLRSAAAELPLVWNQIPDEWLEAAASLITLEHVRERLHCFADPADPAWNPR